MQYMVKGADGNEYGPADVNTLRQWATEGRLDAQTMLRDFGSGATVAAGSVAGIFPPQNPAPPQYGAPHGQASPGQVPPGNWSQPPTAGYQRPVQSQYADEGYGFVLGIIVRCGIGLALFFLLKGLGLIVTGYALVYAIQGQSRGHKHGALAIGIAVASLAILGIGWALRINGAGI